MDVPPPTRARRPQPWSRRLHAALEAVRHDMGQFRRLLTWTKPYRLQLFSSWFATLGYAAGNHLAADYTFNVSVPKTKGR